MEAGRIDMAGIPFGIAFAECGLDARQIGDFIGIPDFDAAQIPAEALDSQALRQRMETLPLKSLHLGALMDKSVSRNIASAAAGMRRGFLEQADILIRKAANVGVSAAALDLALESALDDPALRSPALSIARGLAPATLKTEVDIILPFRIPSLSKPGSPGMAAFLSGSMLPRLKARLDIHPHELPKQFNPKELVKGLEFEARAALFIYDADSGNQLVKGHLAPWAGTLAAVGFKGPFLFCPQSKSRQRLAAEIDALSKFVREMRNP